jgi:hypothetical protein
MLATIEENIENLNDYFTIDAQSISESDLILDLPEYFLNVLSAETKRWNYEASGFTNTYIEYKLVYTMYANVSKALKSNDPAKLKPNEIAVYNKVKEVIAEYIHPNMTDYDKELAIHDYIINSVEYDNSASLPEESHTPYGALIKGRAVCNGYSDSFKIFMDALGIECEIVYGEAGSKSQKHAWNRVKLDDEYYLVDLTWNEPEPSFPEYISYDYFNLTDEQMNKDHKPYSSVYLCTADTYNYYRRNNYLAYDQSYADAVMVSALKSNQKVCYLKGVGFTLSRMSFQVFGEYLLSGKKLNHYYNPHFNTMVIFLE